MTADYVAMTGKSYSTPEYVIDAIGILKEWGCQNEKFPTIRQAALGANMRPSRDLPIVVVGLLGIGKSTLVDYITWIADELAWQIEKGNGYFRFSVRPADRPDRWVAAITEAYAL